MTETDRERNGDRRLDVAPPGRLKRKIVDRLLAEGLMTRQPDRRWLLPGGLGFAAGMLVATVILLGWNAPTRPTASHALLLYDTETMQQLETDQIVSEYRTWAGSLAARGQLIAGEELGGPARWLGRPEPDSSGVLTPNGLFLISVGSAGEAVALARETSHARHGGWVEVRPIVRH